MNHWCGCDKHHNGWAPGLSAAGGTWGVGFGDSIEEFIQKYELTITNLLNALPKDVKNFLLGIKKGSQTNDFFTPIIGFPLYDDKQGLQAGQPNENQSPGFKVKAL